MKYTRLDNLPIGSYKLYIGSHVQNLEVTNTGIVVDGIVLSDNQRSNLEFIERHEDVLYVPISEL